MGFGKLDATPPYLRKNISVKKFVNKSVKKSQQKISPIPRGSISFVSEIKNFFIDIIIFLVIILLMTMVSIGLISLLG